MLQVLEGGGPGALCIIVDCPNEKYLEALVTHPAWEAFRPTSDAATPSGHSTGCIIHLAPGRVRDLSLNVYDDACQCHADAVVVMVMMRVSLEMIVMMALLLLLLVVMVVGRADGNNYQHQLSTSQPLASSLK